MQPDNQPAEIYTHTAFRKACEEGDLAKVNALIVGSTKEVLNEKDEDGRNALHYVAMHGMVPEIKTLIEIGVNPYRDNEGNFPLDLAIKNGNQEAQEILKQYDLDLGLQFCSINNDFVKIKELLEKGANTEFKHKWSEERNAFHFATTMGNVQSMNMLIKHGINVNITDIKGFSALHLASSRNKVNAVNLILKTERVDLNTEGVDLNLANKNGYTPILTAIENGHIEILQSLLDANASLDVINKKGETAYKIAERNDNTQIFNRVDLNANQLAILKKQADAIAISNANQLAILKKQADAIAISKKTEEGINKVTEWLKIKSVLGHHEGLPSIDPKTTLTEISQPQASEELPSIDLKSFTKISQPQASSERVPN